MATNNILIVGRETYFNFLGTDFLTFYFKMLRIDVFSATSRFKDINVGKGGGVGKGGKTGAGKGRGGVKKTT